MASKLSFEMGLALFGLFMAAVELYVPELSLKFEKSIAGLQQRSVRGGDWLKELPGAIHGWVMESRPGRLYASYWWVVSLVAGVLAAALALAKLEDPATALAGVAGLPFVIFIAYRYLMDYLWYFSWIPRSIFFAFDKVVIALNVIGKGKALSGVGLVLALWGLVGPLLSDWSN